MPRNYKRKEGSKPYNKVGRNMDGTIEGVRCGKSVREFAKEYGVHYSILQISINGNIQYITLKTKI